MLKSRLEFTAAAAHFAMVHSYTSGTVVAELLERGPEVTPAARRKGRQLKAAKKYDWLAVAILFVGAVVVLIFASLE